MHRVKKIEYDEDDFYGDEEDDGEEGDGYTEEDKGQFATLTPVVRAELDEAGLQASDREIEEALWHYYWDVGKSVSYLKNTRTPRPQQEPKKEKPKSKFEQAAEKSASQAGESESSFLPFGMAMGRQKTEHGGASTSMWANSAYRGGCLPVPLQTAHDWFHGVPWTKVPAQMEGNLVPADRFPPLPRLLGGSSKLAKLAEERRRKTAASQPAQDAPKGALSSLDRLSRPKAMEENKPPQPTTQTKKYPIRKKREPTPPPREPTPPPEEPKEQLPDLRASPTAFGRTLSTSSHPGILTDRMTLKDVLGTGTSNDPFKGPSPDDVVLQAQKTSDKKATHSKNGLVKKTEALKLDATPSPAPQPKVKSKGLDVPQLWAQSSDRKPSAAFVVIGHVDHGKSTLMGRLLLDTGAVAQRDIDRYKKQATELGKASFALAWVMDTGSDERERGVTVDIAQHHFSTDGHDFTILDAPGHRDFVPNMIAGASMADLAVLVVDANQLESGMKGQTREHVALAKACGLKRIIVAVNKLDSTAPPWDEAVFDDVKAEILKFLNHAGFTQENVAFVPCSGLNGQNVVNQRDVEDSARWVTSASRTLLQELENSTSETITVETVKEPLRMQIADVFRGGIMNPLSVSGRIASGSVQVGDSVIIQPSGETATIRGIESGGDGKDWAVAGQLCSLHLTDIDAQHLRAGDLLCSVSNPVQVVSQFEARVLALDAFLPQGVDVHIGRLHAAGNVRQLVATVDNDGEVLKKRPRVVKAGQRASIKVILDSGAPLAVDERLVLRSNGTTIAAGRIERVGG